MAVISSTDLPAQDNYKFLNRLTYAFTRRAEDLTTAATGDIFVMFDASDNYQAKWADADNVKEALGLDTGSRRVAVADANYQVLAANSGKPHLVANVSADRTFTLPAAADGLDIEFIAQVGAADGHDWIITTGSVTNYWLGGVVHLDADATTGAAEVVLVAPNLSAHYIVQVNLPSGGTRIRCVCDGTLWTISGFAVSTTVPAFSGS
jgi:hypothetical protein